MTTAKTNRLRVLVIFKVVTGVQAVAVLLIWGEVTLRGLRGRIVVKLVTGVAIVEVSVWRNIVLKVVFHFLFILFSFFSSFSSFYSLSIYLAFFLYFFYFLRYLLFNLSICLHFFLSIFHYLYLFICSCLFLIQFLYLSLSSSLCFSISQFLCLSLHYLSTLSQFIYFFISSSPSVSLAVLSYRLPHLSVLPSVHHIVHPSLHCFSVSSISYLFLTSQSFHYAPSHLSISLLSVSSISYPLPHLSILQSVHHLIFPSLFCLPISSIPYPLPHFSIFPLCTISSQHVSTVSVSSLFYSLHHIPILPAVHHQNCLSLHYLPVYSISYPFLIYQSIHLHTPTHPSITLSLIVYFFYLSILPITHHLNPPPLHCPPFTSPSIYSSLPYQHLHNPSSKINGVLSGVNIRHCRTTRLSKCNAK